MDFSTLIKRLVDEARLTFREGQQLGKLTYHDSCHLQRTLNVHEEPRELMKKAGFELVEMFESDMCCGMWGALFSQTPRNLSTHAASKAYEHQGYGSPYRCYGLSRLCYAN
jgi:Fe-S oxidoreductase